MNQVKAGGRRNMKKWPPPDKGRLSSAHANHRFLRCFIREKAEVDGGGPAWSRNLHPTLSIKYLSQSQTGADTMRHKYLI